MRDGHRSDLQPRRPGPCRGGKAAYGRGMSTRTQRQARLRWATISLIALGAVATIVVVRDALTPFLFGMILAAVADRPVGALVRRGVPRSVAAIVVIAAFIVIGARLITLIAAPLAAEIAAFAVELPRYAAGASAWVGEQLRVLREAGIAEPTIEALEEAIASSGTRLADLAGQLLVPAIASAASFASTIVSVAVLPIFVYYLLRDRDQLVEGAAELLPRSLRPDLRALTAIAGSIVGRWARGQATAGLIVGITTFCGLLLIAALIDPQLARYAILLSVIAGLLELVPIVGPIIAAIPAIVAAIAVSPTAAIAVGLLYLLIQQVENAIIVPRIAGGAVNLHPAAVIVTIVAGSAIGGVAGAIIALPATAILRDSARYAIARTADRPATPVAAARLVGVRLARPVVRRRPSLRDRRVQP